MKRSFAFLVVVIVLIGCESRYPTNLSASDQLQCIVLENVISDFRGRLTNTEERNFLLFLATGEPYLDVSTGVEAYITESYDYARPYREATVGSRYVREEHTGRPGAIVWVAPLTVAGNEPIRVVAGYNAGPTRAASLEYIVQRIKGKWTILSHRMTTAS